MPRANRHFLPGHVWHLTDIHLLLKDTEESVIARSPAVCWVCASALGTSFVNRRCSSFEAIADMLYWCCDLDRYLSQQAGRG